MKKYIQHLRQKPETHRKRVAFGVSAGVTLIIATVWFTSFNYFNGESDNIEVAKVNNDNSPLNVLKKGVANAYEAVTGSHVSFSKDEATSSAPALEYVPEPTTFNQSN